MLYVNINVFVDTFYSIKNNIWTILFLIFVKNNKKNREKYEFLHKINFLIFYN